MTKGGGIETINTWARGTKVNNLGMSHSTSAEWCVVQSKTPARTQSTAPGATLVRSSDDKDKDRGHAAKEEKEKSIIAERNATCYVSATAAKKTNMYSVLLKEDDLRCSMCNKV